MRLYRRHRLKSGDRQFLRVFYLRGTTSPGYTDAEFKRGVPMLDAEMIGLFLVVFAGLVLLAGYFKRM